jgi:hypothetical protein
MAEEAKDAGVDSTPISPVKSLERRNSLEKQLQASHSTAIQSTTTNEVLQNRPEEQDLKNRHILLDTTAAPALQAKQAELERQRITDNLRKGLEKRPEKDELVQKNILRDSQAAPGLQEKQHELEMHMRADSLEKNLLNRPKPEDLVKEGILKEDENSVQE